MRALSSTLVTLTLLVSGCSTSSTPSQPPHNDAGPGDATAADASLPQSMDSGPLEEAGDAAVPDLPDDASPLCDMLKAMVEELIVPAKVCSPNGSQQCAGEVMGICCPFTVTVGNEDAVANVTAAVMAYQTQCNPNCAGTNCSLNVPSHTCIGSGSTGTCQ